MGARMVAGLMALCVALSGPQALAKSKELRVQVVAHQAGASAGGTGNALLLVVVTYDGKGAVGLTQGDFLLGNYVVPAGAAYLEIVQLGEQVKGAYLLSIAPHTGNVWQSGTYLFQLIAVKGKKQGQTVGRLDIP